MLKLTLGCGWGGVEVELRLGWVGVVQFLILNMIMNISPTFLKRGVTQISRRIISNFSEVEYCELSKLRMLLRFRLRLRLKFRLRLKLRLRLRLRFWFDDL